MRKTEGFQPLFLKTNTKTNERYCIFLQYPSFFYSVVPKCDSRFFSYELLGSLTLTGMSLLRKRYDMIALFLQAVPKAHHNLA